MERRLTAILAADVVGYSRLMTIDETGTLAALTSLRKNLVNPKISEHNGRIFKLTGDGMLIEFPSVVSAVACAVDIQSAMRTRNATEPAARIEFRIGVNLGDIIVEDGDIFGDGVNVAARLESIAAPLAGLPSPNRCAITSANDWISPSRTWVSADSRISKGQFAFTVFHWIRPLPRNQ